MRGTGEPLVFLHGWLGDGQGFTELEIASTLGETFQVIAPDLRGHGDSDKPVGEENYGLHLVDDVIRLLDYLEIKEAHFIGYSMGGMILGKLLVDHPDRVKSAVIGGTGGMRDYFNYKFADAFVAAIERGAPTGEALIESLPHLGLPDLDESRESFRALNQLDGQVMASIPNSWKELEVSEEELGRIEKPVLVLVGDQEMPFNIQSAEDLKRLVPNCRLVKLEGETHGTALTSPEFTSECQSFLMSTRGEQLTDLD